MADERRDGSPSGWVSSQDSNELYDSPSQYSDSSIDQEQKERALQRREQCDNHPGPGHTFDVLYQRIGDKVGDCVDDLKKNLRLGVTGVSHGIRQHRRHEGLTIVDLYHPDNWEHSFSELRKIEKRCESLLRLARSPFLLQKLNAYKKITHFAIFDPVLRIALANIVRKESGLLFKIEDVSKKEIAPYPLNCLRDVGGNHEVAAAWKAVVALSRQELHDLWRRFYILICASDPTPESDIAWFKKEFLPSVAEHVKDPRTSSLFIQHWYYALKAVRASQKASQYKMPAGSHNVDNAKLSFIHQVNYHLQEAFDSAKHEVDIRLLKRSMDKHRRVSMHEIQDSSTSFQA